jgi:IS4 transposase
MEGGSEITIYHEFKVNKNQSNFVDENILIFLKQIYDSKSEKNYDWVFATNTKEFLLNNLVVFYKKRWRIETMFLVQDEARIKCKSKDMKIRYFLFLFEQMLRINWICFYKDKISFKKYLMMLASESISWTK